jgi:hypothetical protein
MARQQDQINIQALGDTKYHGDGIASQDFCLGHDTFSVAAGDRLFQVFRRALLR